MNRQNEQGAGAAPLSGRRALVTGAGTGLGAAIAVALAAAGASVGIACRSSAAGANAVVERIRAAGGTAHLLLADLLDPASRDALVDSFVAAAGGIEILVNNAGGTDGYVDFRELGEESWDRTMDLNAKAPLWLSRAAWPHMERAGGGRIINIGTAAVRYGGNAKGAHYVASKAALEGLTTTLARAGLSSNILVNAIRCGMFDTEMYRHIEGYTEEQYRRRQSQIPLGRAGRPEEVAAMVVLLAGEGGGFITGQIITVAGGD